MTEDTSPKRLVDRLIEDMSESRPRRRFPRWLILIVILLLIAAGGVIYYLIMPLNAPIPADAGAHMDQGTTEQGFPRLGRADAPITIEEFASYACPHCRDFHLERFPDLLDEIAAGQVQFVMIPVPHIGLGAENAAKGALCAGQQGQFWTMNDVLFDWQKRFVMFTFDKRRIKKGAANMGLDTQAFDNCLDGDYSQNLVDLARREFDRRGLSGTPSFFINGEKVRDYSEFDNLSVNP